MALPNAKTVASKTDTTKRKSLSEVVEERIVSASERGFNSCRCWMRAGDERTALLKELAAKGYEYEILAEEKASANYEISWT